MVLGRRVSTTVEGRSIWCYFGETRGYHSRLEGYSVCPGEACLCQLLTDNLLPVYNFVQKCIMLAKNVMSVLALSPVCRVVTSKTAAIHAC